MAGSEAPLPSFVQAVDRRVDVSETGSSVYAFGRAWVKDDPTHTLRRPTAPRADDMSMPAPHPHSDGSRMRLQPEPKSVDKETILAGRSAHTTAALLDSHVSYFRELKRWFTMQHGYRAARYADRLDSLNLRVAPGALVSPGGDAGAMAPATALSAAVAAAIAARSEVDALGAAAASVGAPAPSHATVPAALGHGAASVPVSTAADVTPVPVENHVLSFAAAQPQPPTSSA